MQHRPASIDEQLRGGGNIGRITAGTVAAGRGVVERRHVQLAGPNVARQLQQNWPRFTVAQLAEGSAHQFRNPIGEIQSTSPASDVLVHGQRVELGRLAKSMLIRTARYDQQGYRVAEGLSQGAEGVFDAWSSL